MIQLKKKYFFLVLVFWVGAKPIVKVEHFSIFKSIISRQYINFFVIKKNIFTELLLTVGFFCFLYKLNILGCWLLLFFFFFNFSLYLKLS